MLKQILAFAAIFMMSAPVYADFAEMKIFADKNRGPFIGDYPIQGYVIQKVDFFVWPEAMKNKISQINAERTEQWSDYVWNSEENEHLDDDAKQHMIDNADFFWGSQTPLRLDGLFEIYRNGKLIGYVADFADMVDSAIIQDGSGWVFFVEAEDGSLVEVQDWQS